MSEHVVLLKRTVRARSLAEEGIAVSMGATAVVLRGAQTERVWRALEPVLRSGFTRSALVAGFPKSGRPFLKGMLDQLEEHRFLREAEQEVPEEELSQAQRAAYPHLEALTPRPFAALRALAESTVRVRSECPLLEAEVRRALARSGIGEVGSETGPNAPGTLLAARIATPGAPEALYLVAAGRGVWVSGPRNAPADGELAGRLRAWFARLPEEGGPEGYAGADDPGLSPTRTLVAAQLALALVAHAARTAGGAEPTAADPEFMVTTDELVSEPHPFAVLPDLDPATVAESPEPEEPPDTVTGRLDAVTHLWDRVFGPVGEPVPGDLPQLPAGLARIERGTAAGCGSTTAEARADALAEALHAVVWRSAPSGTGRGVGLTRAAAIGEAIGDLALSDGRWKDVDPPEALSASARRLWSALTLRFGVPAKLLWCGLDGTGLWRVDAVSPEGTVLGSSAAADPDACLCEALLRAVASAQADLPGLARRSARTPAVTASLSRWVAATGLVRVAAPEGAAAWAARGVHTAVASWT